MTDKLSIDVFCRVVDFFGDIGICWRLVRQLHHDLGCEMRIIVDDFVTFKKIVSGIDEDAGIQTYDGITILKWDDAVLNHHYTQPADAVIEAFACTLPDMVVEKMRIARPVWIDLEYLSAEDWVEGCHAIPSWHPMTGLTKTLFFPGFTPRTGGLFREHALITRRDAFQNDINAQNAWRASIDLPPVQDGIIDVSLFCYANAPARILIQAMDRSSVPVRLFVTSGIAEEALTRAGIEARADIFRIKFLSQDDFDRLLWTSDINFIRGEDSFVRAIWAGKPMVWHIHPQKEQAHMVKLQAFMDLYTAEMDPECAETLENFAVLWNERGRTQDDQPLPNDPDWLSLLPRLSSDVRKWTETLLRQQDLATQLTGFIRQQITQEQRNIE